MSQITVEDTVRRIARHAEARSLDRVAVSIHGGEPLMAGSRHLGSFAKSMRAALGSRLSLSIQTNGLLVDRRALDLFLEHDVLVGLSLDGPRVANDEWRTDHNGKGTYERVIAALRRLQNASKSENLKFGGVISVINPRQDVNAFYKWIKDEGVRAINLLLPDANHENYSKYYPYQITDFSSFLIPLFDLWWDDQTEFRPNIRLFESILSRTFGHTSSSESVGTGEAPAIIIETDGSIQAHDVLRTTLIGHTYSGNVHSDDIDVIELDPLYRAINPSLFGSTGSCLPSACKNCPASDICRGGFVAHRFSKERMFDNQSVYCEALFSTITHIYLRASASFTIRDH